MIPFKPSLSLWMGAAVAAAVLASIFLHFREDGQIRDRLIAMTADRDRIAEKLGRAELAVTACLQVNLENAQARDRAAEQAADAEKRAQEAAAHAETEINGILAELDRLRARNLGCPAIDAEFRDWMRQ